jgi:hypothetical protein
MKKFLFLFLSCAVLTACSSDDSSSTNSTTKAVIILKSTNGAPVSNVVVYAYDQINWEMSGDETFFADFQASSNSEGSATFNNIFSDTGFNQINNFTNTFRFSAHYALNGINKTKVVAITFQKGDSKTETITLN